MFWSILTCHELDATTSGDAHMELISGAFMTLPILHFLKLDIIILALPQSFTRNIFEGHKSQNTAIIMMGSYKSVMKLNKEY